MMPTWQLSLTILAHQSPVGDLALSADEQYLVTVGWDKYLKLWELASGKLLDSQQAHAQGILCVACTSIPEAQVATGGFDQQIKLWSVSRELQLQLTQTLTHHSGSIRALEIISELGILVSGSYDQTVKQWNIETGEKICSSLAQETGIYTLAVNLPRQAIASGGGDGRVNLWQLQTGNFLTQLRGNLSGIECLTFSNDGQFLAAGCVDGTIKLWQLQDPYLAEIKLLPALIAHSGGVISVIFDPNNLLLSAGADGLIKTWSLASPPFCLSSFDTESQISSLITNPGGNLLLTGSFPGVVKVWQAA